MSIDFTHDYSKHTLLENANKYTEIYKLEQTDISFLNRGDLIMLKDTCNKYSLFIVLDVDTETGNLNLSPYHNIEYIRNPDKITLDNTNNTD